MEPGPIEIPLRQKYLLVRKAKRTKKKGNGNSGHVGRKGRKAKRGIVVSQHNSPEQFNQWKRAYGVQKDG